jgi:hypothetical protein
MYYPKSQIKTNLYTNGGDFILLNNSTPYVGYYYETSNGRYFTGQNPNESPSFELIKISVSSSSAPQISEDNFYLIETRYYASKNLPLNQTPPSLPKQSYPIVTENDYKLGEFQRYFVKKGNEPKFIEISKEDHLKYVSQDRDVMFELYVPIQINWVLTGDKDQVYKTNQNIVIRAERDNNLPGFEPYFKGKFTQFYK